MEYPELVKRVIQLKLILLSSLVVSAKDDGFITATDSEKEPTKVEDKKEEPREEKKKVEGPAKPTKEELGAFYKKIDGYFEARRENKPPQCWHDIYRLVTRSKSKEEIEQDIQKKSAGLELIRGNNNFAGMVPQYEAQIRILKDKTNAFESAEMMLPHMVRFTKDRLRSINLKKIKTLSKKLAKQDKGKK